MYLLYKSLMNYYKQNNYESIFAPLSKPLPPNPNLLRDAIEDAKVVRATVLANSLANEKIK